MKDYYLNNLRELLHVKLFTCIFSTNKIIGYILSVSLSFFCSCQLLQECTIGLVSVIGIVNSMGVANALGLVNAIG